MRRYLLPILILAALAAMPATAAARPTQFTMFEAPRELLSDDGALRSRTFDEIDRFGVRWLRVVLYWQSVAPDPDSRTRPAFDETDPNAYPGFGRYDRLLQEARAHRMRVLLTVTGPVPRWATKYKDDYVSRPSPTRFQRFMTAVIRRYGSQVDRWAVWNEPNHPDFLGPQYTGQGRKRRPASPRIYRSLFFAADRAFRVAGDKSDRVFAGETAPMGTRKVVTPLAFLRGTLCLNSRYRKRKSCKKLPADGWAHHAYTPKSGPRYRPQSPNNVTIGVLSRLTRALDRAGRARAIRKRAPVYLTEFGIQSWPDHASGVSQTRQNEFRAMSERIAYRNKRVYAFSQYLMRDDLSRRNGPKRERYGGFESGLRTESGRKKKAYAGFPVPLVATRGRSTTSLWGLVRPATKRTRVRIEYRDKGRKKWRRLKSDRTNSRGYWSTRTRAKSGRVYRVRWTSPDRVRYVGPLTRAYR